MPRDLSEMTLDELRALPEFEPFDRLTVKVQPDGTATHPNGRVLRGLTVGVNVSFPVVNEVQAAYYVSGDTPMCWQDADGVTWTPVKLTTGEWRRQRLAT